MRVGSVHARQAPISAPPLPVLEVRGLTKRYGRRVVLRDLSLTLEPGQVLGLLGPNGAGKTTAICALLGLVRPDAGKVLILGIDARRAPQAALRHVGALVESPAFYPYLSGWENLAILARLRRVPERQIATSLDRVGLTQAAQQRVGTYSLGMRQRLAIAAAILHEPALLILDEPTNGLDPQGIVEVRELVRSLAAGGQTILLCSHVLAEVQQTCSHVLILAHGEPVATGALADLLTGNRTFRLRTPERARLHTVLQQLSWVQVLEENGEIVRLLIPPERQEAFSRLLVEHGVPVLELCREETTLEQFFLAMTEADTSASGEPRRRRSIWSGVRG